MSEDKGSGRWSLIRALLGPSPRIVGEEATNEARLLAALTLVHFLAAALGTVVTTTYWVGSIEQSMLWGPVGAVLLVCSLIVLVAYALVRAGSYRASLTIYLATSAIFPLAVLYVGYPRLDVGVLTSALLPIVIAATLLSYRWVAVVAVATLASASPILSVVESETRDARVVFSILVTLSAGSALMVW